MNSGIYNIHLQANEDLFFNKLYKKNFNRVLNFVNKNSGTRLDAEDLFQDAMIVLLEKLRQDNFVLTASIHTYVYAICKNLWLKKLRDQSRKYSLDYSKQNNFQESISESIDEETGYLEKILMYLSEISAHCNKLIQDIFFEGKSMEQIQKEYGYTTKHNAQNQKYKCINQIKKVKNKLTVGEKK